MARNCGMCGKEVRASELIEEPHADRALCRKCAREMGVPAPSVSPHEGAGCDPTYMLTEAAGRVSFWIWVFGILDVLAGMVLVCLGCVAARSGSEAWLGWVSGVISFMSGMALLALARWFTFFNAVIHEMDKRTRFGPPRPDSRCCSMH